MTKSIRKLRSEIRQRSFRDSERTKNRVDAINAVKEDSTITVRQLASSFFLSRGIAHKIKRAAQLRGISRIEELASPRTHRAGRKSVLSEEERNLLAESAERFLADGRLPTENAVRVAMGQIAADGGKNSYKSGMPCRDAFLQFRAERSDLALRRNSEGNAAKSRAENFEHANSHATALEEVFKKHPHLQRSPEAIINLDETEVRTEFGERVRALTPKSSRTGAPKPTFPGSEKHATAVIAASAAGRVAPPFFAVAGKNTMNSWAEPLDSRIFNLQGGLEIYGRGEWLDNEAAICATPEGSMEIALMHSLIDHINRFFRKFTPQQNPILVLLGGHSSRNGFFWLMKATKLNAEVVKSPANASHFLQPCDSGINKKLHQHIRKTRDALLRNSAAASAGAPQFKIICASHALRSIAAADVIRSLDSAGLWPLGMRFVEPFRSDEKQARGLLEREKAPPRASKRGAARQMDSEAANEMQMMLRDRGTGPANALQKASDLLANVCDAWPLLPPCHAS